MASPLIPRCKSSRQYPSDAVRKRKLGSTSIITRVIRVTAISFTSIRHHLPPDRFSSNSFEHQKLPIDPCHCGKPFRRNFNRYRFLPVSEYDDAHFRDRARNLVEAESMSVESASCFTKISPPTIELLRELLGRCVSDAEWEVGVVQFESDVAVDSVFSRRQRGVDRPFARDSMASS